MINFHGKKQFWFILFACVYFLSEFLEYDKRQKKKYNITSHNFKGESERLKKILELFFFFFFVCMVLFCFSNFFFYIIFWLHVTLFIYSRFLILPTFSRLSHPNSHLLCCSPKLKYIFYFPRFFPLTLHISLLI